MYSKTENIQVFMFNNTQILSPSDLNDLDYFGAVVDVYVHYLGNSAAYLLLASAPQSGNNSG
jgi:hypothetical protein